MRAQRLAVSLAALAVAASACGTTVGGSATGAPGTSTDGFGVVAAPGASSSADGRGAVPAPGPQAAWSGGPVRAGRSPVSTGERPLPDAAAPRVTAPLKVGVLYIGDDSANTALGASTGASLTGDRVVRALVAQLNSRGGLAHRRIVPSYYAISSTTTDYSVASSAACEHFSRDAKVEVVLDLALGVIGDLAACLARNRIYQYTVGAETDVAGQRDLPLHTSLARPAVDRAYTAVVAQLTRAGYLSRTHRVGVVVEDCADIDRAMTRSIAPAFHDRGLAVVSTFHLDCGRGYADLGPAASAMSSAVLQFRSAGVDRVMFLSHFEQVALLLFAPSAESQRYRPGYLLTSGAQASVVRANLPSGQWPQLHGVGQQRVLDTDGPESPLSPSEQRCLRLSADGGAPAKTWSDDYIVWVSCSLFLGLEAGLEASHGQATPAVLAQAMASLGRSLRLPGVLGGETHLSATRPDAPSRARVFGFASNCSCMAYSGPSAPLD